MSGQSWLDGYRERRSRVEGGEPVAAVALALGARRPVSGPSHDDLAAARERFLAVIARESAHFEAQSRTPSLAARLAPAWGRVSTAVDSFVWSLTGSPRVFAPAAAAAAVFVAALLGFVGGTPDSSQAALHAEVRALSRVTSAATADGLVTETEVIAVESRVGGVAAAAQPNDRGVFESMARSELETVIAALDTVGVALANSRTEAAERLDGPAQRLHALSGSARDALARRVAEAR
jgi:hypothetical protein